MAPPTESGAYNQVGTAVTCLEKSGHEAIQAILLAGSTAQVIVAVNWWYSCFHLRWCTVTWFNFTPHSEPIEMVLPRLREGPDLSIYSGCFFISLFRAVTALTLRLHLHFYLILLDAQVLGNLFLAFKISITFVGEPLQAPKCQHTLSFCPFSPASINHHHI